MRVQTMEPKQKHDSCQEWQLVEDTFDIEASLVRETLFTVGNGYIGLRGAHEEGFKGFAGKTLDETFINGFYESSPLHYQETAYGWAKVHQFMLNVPNAKCINFSIDGENFDLFQGKIIRYDRSIDFRTGILCRNIEWSSTSGRRVSVSSRRLTSFPRKHLFAIQYEIKSLNFSGLITLRTAIDCKAKNVEEDKPRYGAAVGAVEGQHLQLLKTEQSGDYSALLHQTKNSKLMIVSAVENELSAEASPEISPELVSTHERAEHIYRINVKEGDTICLTKYGVYFTSREHPEHELMVLAKKALRNARQAGFSSLCSEQKEFLSDFWHHADVEITGDDPLQQGVRFNQFHLLQSVGRDGITSIAAKGLTGEGYGGHYFWDAEIYTLPFYLYTRPQIARKMLDYRYSTLDKARARAREMSHDKGALYAWRTITGEECSTYFPGGTAQYHINADIAYAIKQYYEATADEEFMVKYGAEMIMETARIWMGIGTYVGRRDNQFCINEVTGPDEYTALVDNNFYTNAMAQMHLRLAADWARKMKNEYPSDFRRLKLAMDFSDEEPKQWIRAADSMFLPYDEELGIHPQDDKFLYKKKWDLTKKSGKSFDLPLHHHYLVIYRHQVCKQADVVLAMFLLGNHFALEDKKRNYDYYEAITTHDSSLSHSTFSIIASEVGYHDKAYQYFTHTTRGDLDDLHGNTSYGVHIAAMAGAWMAVVNGFAGMRVYEGNLQFAPYMPEKWERYSFRIYFKSQLLLVEIDRRDVKYSLLEGDALELKHSGLQIQLTHDHPVEVVPIAANKEGFAIKKS